MSMIFDNINDENVLFTLGIVAVSSVITVIAIIVGFRVISRNQREVLSTANKKGKEKHEESQSDGRSTTEGDVVKLGEGREAGKGDEGTKDPDKAAYGDESDMESLPELIPNGNAPERDPFDYCEHIQGEVKKIQQNLATKKIQETMTDDQMLEEREAQRKQLEAIFALMQNDDDKFGIKSMEDISSQMKLYA